MDFLPFRVPRKLLDTEQESSDSLYVRECTDFSVMQPREITETLKGISPPPDSALRVFYRHSRFYLKLGEFMPFTVILSVPLLAPVQLPSISLL